MKKTKAYCQTSLGAVVIKKFGGDVRIIMNGLLKLKVELSAVEDVQSAEG